MKQREGKGSRKSLRSALTSSDLQWSKRESQSPGIAARLDLCAPQRLRGRGAGVHSLRTETLTNRTVAPVDEKMRAWSGRGGRGIPSGKQKLQVSANCC